LTVDDRAAAVLGLVGWQACWLARPPPDMPRLITTPDTNSGPASPTVQARRWPTAAARTQPAAAAETAQAEGWAPAFRPPPLSAQDHNVPLTAAGPRARGGVAGDSQSGGLSKVGAVARRLRQSRGD
jgi:hypothetical protein